MGTAHHDEMNLDDLDDHDDLDDIDDLHWRWHSHELMMNIMNIQDSRLDERWTMNYSFLDE